MAKKSWSDMTRTQKKVVVATGDRGGRGHHVVPARPQGAPAELVRGPKALWGPAMSVQPVGPIAYLVWGRKR